MSVDSLYEPLLNRISRRGFMLKIRPKQIDYLRELKLMEVRRRTVVYLREYAAKTVSGWSDEDLWAEVISAERSGIGQGLKSEQAHRLWAFLHVATGGALQRDPRFIQAVEHGTLSPDQIVETLFNQLIAQAK